MKRCGQCFQHKPRDQFSPGGGTRDGLHSWCKLCRSEDERSRRKNPKRRGTHQLKYEQHRLYRARILVAQIKKRARAEGVPFDLTPEWLQGKLMAGTCELTGLEFNFALDQRMMAPSVDRVRAGAGYTQANCRVVLYAINMALSDYGLEAFLPLARALAERNPR